MFAIFVVCLTGSSSFGCGLKNLYPGFPWKCEVTKLPAIVKFYDLTSGTGDVVQHGRLRLEFATKLANRDPTTRRQRERRLKRKFAFFYSLSRLFHSFTLSNVGEPSWSWIPGIISKFRKRNKIWSLLVEREISHFHVVVVQKRQRNVQKSVMHVQNCFAY